jgi:hypothetical protein
MKSVFNKYQDYELETNQSAYEYEKSCYEREEEYRQNIRKDLDREYFGDKE